MFQWDLDTEADLFVAGCGPESVMSSHFLRYRSIWNESSVDWGIFASMGNAARRDFTVRLMDEWKKLGPGYCLWGRPF